MLWLKYSQTNRHIYTDYDYRKEETQGSPTRHSVANPVGWLVTVSKGVEQEELALKLEKP